MIRSVVKFTDDAAGLEKTLRLIQGFCTIAVGLAVSPADADLWAKTRGQFALGRRYFRLLKWYPCFVKASNAVSAERLSISTILDTIKWTFLSLYFFLEMFTITNAMGITKFDWGPKVQHEANKCWVYSLIASILLSMVELLWDNVRTADASSVGKDEKKSRTETSSQEKQPSTARSKLYIQLMIDSCDILIPGSAVGWSPSALAVPLVVGVASTISTTLAGSQIWQRVQREPRQ
ncbi:uncharacterized protein RCC_10773 [Ramularia collo-cygni]|uniref:PEX11 domain protein n=1 Tax=Ramularia collo-cygni TaxID=112498 RepID=A0A2D3VGE1_9PEZI|nr:uncharacterized protein RCC_10773 [Ramularia collo-cygni]CZT25045.1 uncharacterized protein RCC_10773 [Ramularia collo-cygni]